MPKISTFGIEKKVKSIHPFVPQTSAPWFRSQRHNAAAPPRFVCEGRTGANRRPSARPRHRHPGTPPHPTRKGARNCRACSSHGCGRSLHLTMSLDPRSFLAKVCTRGLDDRRRHTPSRDLQTRENKLTDEQFQIVTSRATSVRCSSLVSRSICCCCLTSRPASCSERKASSFSCNAMISISALRFTS